MAQPPLRSVSRPSPTVVKAEIEAGGKGWSLDVLLRSDAHHDNALCNRKAERLHLEQAKERGALIVDLGDALCGMQGPQDPRQDRSQLRDEHNRNSYFDAIINEAAGFYAPYCENWLLLAQGNHEQSIDRKHGTDVTSRLAEQMKLRSGAERGPLAGTYQGWVALSFKWGVRKSQTFKMRYTHGYGGGAQGSKDVLQTQRQLAYLENCDFLLSGHTHDAFYIDQEREYLDDYGNTKRRTVAMLKVPGYKDEFSPGSGWAVGKGMPPKPTGGWWIRFTMHDDRIRYEVLRTAPL